MLKAQLPFLGVRYIRDHFIQLWSRISCHGSRRILLPVIATIQQTPMSQKVDLCSYVIRIGSLFHSLQSTRYQCFVLML